MLFLGHLGVLLQLVELRLPFLKDGLPRGEIFILVFGFASFFERFQSLFDKFLRLCVHLERGFLLIACLRSRDDT